MRTGCKLSALLLSIWLLGGAAFAQYAGYPDTLTYKKRFDLANRITKLRLEKLLPRVMRESGIDMWVIVCNEDNLDPVFRTMIPYNWWCTITSILVLYDPGPGREVERLNLSRTDMLGLHINAWDYRAWDREKAESQWDCLARVVRERNPKKIGINESDVIWAADGLTVSLKRKLVETLGPELASRFVSAEKPATFWLETLLDEEFEPFERGAAIAHAIMAEALSSKAIIAGVTTTDDLVAYCNQRALGLGLTLEACTFGIWGRDPKQVEKYGKEDKIIRHGDLVHTDLCLIYLHYHTDFQEWGYVLKPGEAAVPETFRHIMNECNRLMSIFGDELWRGEGRTGNQLLAKILARAKAEGIQGPKIYSHSLGYYLHEPGPLIGLPWEQVDTGPRGEVPLVMNSAFVAELSVAYPVPEWDGATLRFALEQDVVIRPEGPVFLDGRQTEFHLIR
jgi:hypothetical protein